MIAPDCIGAFVVWIAAFNQTLVILKLPLIFRKGVS